MPAIKPNIAVDEIFSRFRTVWVDGGYDVNNIKWPNTEGAVPDGEIIWARASIRHIDGQQASLTQSSPYDVNGLFIVEIFNPLSVGLMAGYLAVDVVLDGFKNYRTESGICFSKHRFKEIGPDGSFYKINTFIQFNYLT